MVVWHGGKSIAAHSVFQPVLRLPRRVRSFLNEPQRQSRICEMNPKTKREPVLQLPKRVEHLLATLHRIYKDEGEHQAQKVIVNSKLRVKEDREGEFDRDYQEMFYGHSVYLDVPEGLYPTPSLERINLQERIKSDINGIKNISNEYISAVFIELEEVEDRDWRMESDVLLPRQRTTTPETAKRIWGSRGFRVFLSHKDTVKMEATRLKEGLALFGISAFVAHKDIRPTKEWQEVIENALASMDALVALLTEEFHGSDWTDQEVGYALGRGVPVISVKRGKSPYGFIAKFQALSCKWDDTPLQLAKLLIAQPRMLNCYIEALPACPGFDEGNLLSQLFPHIDELSTSQIERLMAANNEHRQLRESFGFSGEKPSLYGQGLAFHLSRITGKKFTRNETGEIEMENE